MDLRNWLPFRKRKQAITTIVLHGTAGSSASGAISWLRKIKLSYHLIICDENDPQGDGVPIKCVPDSKVALHAGESKGPDGRSANEYSLGVAFVNAETGKDVISIPQWDTAVQRCVAYARAYRTIKWVTTHAIVSPGRKTDPRGPVEGWPKTGKFPLIQFAFEVSKGAGREILPWGVR